VYWFLAALVVAAYRTADVREPDKRRPKATGVAD
jgi:hypothetical protein